MEKHANVKRNTQPKLNKIKSRTSSKCFKLMFSIIGHGYFDERLKNKVTDNMTFQKLNEISP